MTTLALLESVLSDWDRPDPYAHGPIPGARFPGSWDPTQSFTTPQLPRVRCLSDEQRDLYDSGRWLFP